MENSKSGRRPGSPQTREAILDAAIEAFTQYGYASTTIRGVARAAEVDPALVMHFFTNKDGLFDAAIRHGGMPIQQLTEAMHGPLEGIGERLTDRYLALWEDPVTGPRIRAVITSITASPAAAAILKEFMLHEVALPLVERLGGDHPQERALLAASQLMGLAFARHVIGIEVLTALSRESLVACVAPSIQRFLTGDLQLH